MTTVYYTDSFANALEQFTDYYPYGLPHASATSPEVNSCKYGAKELTTDHGLNLYDFAARWQNPAFPHFTTPDPLAEKYFSISPFTYCAGDPINWTDPTGMIINTTRMTEDQMKAWDQFVETLSSRSNIFKILYDFLDQSPNVINIEFGSTKRSNGDNPGGIFDSESNTIILSVSETGQPNEIDEGCVAEELFHNFQNQNQELYASGTSNTEFEAKTLRALVSYESGGIFISFEYDGLKDIGNNISINDSYGDNMADISNQIIDNRSSFISDYMKYANQFSTYCKVNNIGNYKYHISTTIPPYGLQKIIKMAFKIGSR